MEIKIGNRLIGPNHPPYVIAEISGNHNGDLSRALKLIEIAKESGADAVKIQTYTADTMTIKCDGDDFKIKKGLWSGYTLYDLYQWAHTPWEWHEALINKARSIGIEIISTPFDESAVDFLEKFNMNAYKVASFEAADIPLIKKIAALGKPVIISTGMATYEDICDIVKTTDALNNPNIILLHCVSGYPTPTDQANLLSIKNISENFKKITGLSDHTLGTTTAIAGVALGACVIEKHFIDSRAAKGPDSEFSLEPHELKQLCSSVKEAWGALGSKTFDRQKSEQESMVFKRSLYFVKDLVKGDVITSENMRRIRPGFGLAPKHIDELLGKKITENVKRGTAVKWEHIEKN
jgi:pseudaminic acid synthase